MGINSIYYDSKNKYKKNLKVLKRILIIILFVIIINTSSNINKNNHFTNNLNSKTINSTKFYLFKYFKNYNDKNLFFKIVYLNYSLSFKYNIFKFEYKFGFYTNNNLILPSDLSLYYNLTIFCHLIDINNSNIDSLSYIYHNNYYSCVEFLNLRQQIKFGIKITKNKESIDINLNYFGYKKSINYNSFINIDNTLFEPLIINQNYQLLNEKIKIYSETNRSLKFKKSYIQQPYCSSKQSIWNNGTWLFINIYNNYFCLCKGSNCFNITLPQKCKYYFYLYIIDNSKKIYKKTNYIFADFILSDYSSDDTYPVFQKMIKINMPVHYITEKLEIYEEYCGQINFCKSIILANKKNYTINGDFLEKYLTIFLKLKSAISGAEFFFINNLFYNIDYITYICVGHGVSILKDFLYSAHSYYGHKTYDKILLPPSKKIISIAQKYGWTNNNIIKINLPRWDRYKNNIDKLTHFNKNKKIENDSIFIMFTWRVMKKGKKISSYYLKNIFNLINNEKLNKILNQNNIILYFTLHHKLKSLKNKFDKNKNIEYIYENDISECLSKTNLVVSDFSSIIFDLICREKPYIIYVPDAKDPQIKDIYNTNYYNIIKSIKDNSINFENIFLEVNEVVDKINYYINNNFILEKNLKNFYETFEFRSGNNINDFINYLKNLK